MERVRDREALLCFVACARAVVGASEVSSTIRCGGSDRAAVDQQFENQGEALRAIEGAAEAVAAKSPRFKTFLSGMGGQSFSRALEKIRKLIDAAQRELGPVQSARMNSQREAVESFLCELEASARLR